MKDLMKREMDPSDFICKLCAFQSKTMNGLGRHVSMIHSISTKNYYNKYFSYKYNTGNGKCYACSAPTRFKGLGYGYFPTCSQICSTEYRKYRLMEVYGVDNSLKIPAVVEKSKISMMERYGVDNASKCQASKEKFRNTCFKKYGVYNPSNSPELMEKKRLTMIERCGVENASHSPELLLKSSENGSGKVSRKKYHTKDGRVILVQGSYEKRLVSFCEERNIPIENGPIVHYVLDGKKRKYFLDFKIIVNGITKLVEMKSNYWYFLDKRAVDAKTAAAKTLCDERGWKFYFITNNENKRFDDSKFNILLE